MIFFVWWFTWAYLEPCQVRTHHCLALKKMTRSLIDSDVTPTHMHALWHQDATFHQGLDLLELIKSSYFLRTVTFRILLWLTGSTRNVLLGNKALSYMTVARIRLWLQSSGRHKESIATDNSSEGFQDLSCL